MKSVYLSGPMRGYADFNYPAFDDAARRWKAKGYAVVSPADNFGGRTDLPLETHMRADIASLLQVDAIVMLGGWERSKGSYLERKIAEAIGLEVLRDDVKEETA